MIVGQYGCIHEVLIPIPVKALPTPVAPSDSAASSGSTAPSTSAPTPIGAKGAAMKSPISGSENDPIYKSPSDHAIPVTNVPGNTPEQESATEQGKSKRPAGSSSSPKGTVPSNLPEDVPTNFEVVAKCMVGELKISVLWDRSHRYFPGLRTVVQFSLVG